MNDSSIIIHLQKILLSYFINFDFRSVPAYGHEIGNTLCDILRKSGGLDILIDNCIAEHKELQFQSAKLLQQCLVTANRGYVVEKGLDKVLSVAKQFTDTRFFIFLHVYGIFRLKLDKFLRL